MMRKAKVKPSGKALSACLSTFLLTDILLSGCGPSEHTVSFDMNGGLDGSVPNQKASGKKLTDFPDAVWEGYVFLGWFQDSGLTKRGTGETRCAQI